MSDTPPDFTTPLTGREFREQAAEYIGIMASRWLKADTGELFEIPNRECLDSDQRRRYNQLLVDLRNQHEKLDRAPDVLDDDGKFVRKGAVLDPATIDGELVPDQDDQIAEAVMGDRYATFVKAGGRSSDVTLAWWEMNVRVARRRAGDSKSAASNTDSVPVPDSD